MYHLIYYRENAKQKTFHLFRLERVPLQIVKHVPETLAVRELAQYEAKRTDKLPLLTLATGKFCEQYTYENWHHAKTKRRYEFQRKENLRQFRPTDIHRRYVLIPYFAHIAWYQRDKTLCWTRCSEVFPIQAGSMIVPRQIHCFGRELAKLQKSFRIAFQSMQRKSKLVLMPLKNKNL